MARPPVPHLDHLSGRLRYFPSMVAWEQDRQARRAAGRGEIGGSLVAQILGLRPFRKTPWNAWLTLTGQAPPREESEQAILSEGQVWEPFVVECYRHAAHPVHVWREELGVLSVVGPESWAVVTPDGFVQHGLPLSVGGLEVKTDREASHWGAEFSVIERWTEEAGALVPPMYACQCYWSMYACELPYWDLAAMVPKAWGLPQLRWHRLMRDRAVEDVMVSKLGEWREKHLVRGDPPDIDDSAECRGFLQKLHPGPPKGLKPMRGATEIEEGLVHEWIYAQRRRDEAKGEADRLSNQLQECIGDLYGLHTKHGKLIYYQNPGRRTADMDRLEREFPDAYAACAREGEPYRVLKSYIK